MQDGRVSNRDAYCTICTAIPLSTAAVASKTLFLTTFFDHYWMMADCSGEWTYETILGRPVAKYRKTTPTKPRTQCEKVIGIHLHVLSISIFVSAIYDSYLHLKSVLFRPQAKYHALTIRFGKFCQKILHLSSLLMCYKNNKKRIWEICSHIRGKHL